MKRFKNILLVCNFDVKQQMAVDRAVSLARQNEASLTVFTVVKELPADVRMAITVMPPQELLEQVIADHREKVDALATVMGTVCRTGVAGFFIGNTAEKVLGEVNCSILTVKPEGFVTPVTPGEG